MTAYSQARRFAIAPMVDVTTSVFRRMVRALSKHSLLYTEMIAADAVLHGKSSLLDYKPCEQPLVLQIGASDENKLKEAVLKAVPRGFAAFNLNAGCPSDKVQSGAFGAVLMKDLKKLSALTKVMLENSPVPVSVKTRIGVDEEDSVDFTLSLVEAVNEAGCNEIILHARKAWLQGLSPKENRTVPPIDYERVYLIKRTFPRLHVTINGDIKTLEECLMHLNKVDGVMLGRAVLDNPLLLGCVDRVIFGDAEAPLLTADDILERMANLSSDLKEEGIPCKYLFMHLLNLYNGRPGARAYRKYLSDHMHDLGAGPELLQEAREKIRI